MVGLSPRKDGPADSVQAGTLASEFQGSFEIAGVTPGSYILSGADKDQKFAAIQELDVRGDMDGLFVRLAPATGRGAIYVENGGAPALKGITVKLLPLDLLCCALPRNGSGGRHFRVRSPAAPALHDLGGDLPPDYYVRSIRLDGKEITGAGFAVESDVTFTIGLATGGARLAGAVVDAAGKPAAYPEVTLIPVGSGIPARGMRWPMRKAISVSMPSRPPIQGAGLGTPEDAPYLRARIQMCWRRSPPRPVS